MQILKLREAIDYMRVPKSARFWLCNCVDGDWDEESPGIYEQLQVVFLLPPTIHEQDGKRYAYFYPELTKESRRKLRRKYKRFLKPRESLVFCWCREPFGTIQPPTRKYIGFSIQKCVNRDKKNRETGDIEGHQSFELHPSLAYLRIGYCPETMILEIK